MNSGCKQRQVGTFMLFFFSVCLFLEPEVKNDVGPKRRLIFNGLHGVISQTTELFKSPLSEPQILRDSLLLHSCKGTQTY
jgi:hypothetical protein